MFRVNFKCLHVNVQVINKHHVFLSEQIKMMMKICSNRLLIRPILFDMLSDHSSCQQSSTVVTPHVLLTVEN